MIRTDNFKMPDAINCSVTENFTQIPNSLIRNPNISGKAKALLCLLLSNKGNWKTYIATIVTMMKEGEDAIRAGLEELENHHYLLRLYYRDIRTKVRRGAIWAYTDVPNTFKLDKHIKFLKEKGLEVVVFKREKENPEVAFPNVAERDMENPGLIILNKKIPINKNTNFTSGDEELITTKDFEDYFWKDYPKTRRDSKGAAYTSWVKLCNPKNPARPLKFKIRAALKKQKKSERWMESDKFIPLAVTWLNQKRWMDDAKDLKAYKTDAQNAQEEHIGGDFTDRYREKEDLENED